MNKALPAAIVEDVGNVTAIRARYDPDGAAVEGIRVAAAGKIIGLGETGRMDRMKFACRTVLWVQQPSALRGRRGRLGCSDITFRWTQIIREHASESRVGQSSQRCSRRLPIPPRFVSGAKDNQRNRAGFRMYRRPSGGAFTNGLAGKGLFEIRLPENRDGLEHVPLIWTPPVRRVGYTDRAALRLGSRCRGDGIRPHRLGSIEIRLPATPPDLWHRLDIWIDCPDLKASWGYCHVVWRIGDMGG